MSVLPHILVRVSPLPFNLLEQLQMKKTISLFEQTMKIKARFEEITNKVSELLYSNIAGLENINHKRILLNLKRDIFNNRLNNIPTPILELLDRISKQHLLEWLKLKKNMEDINYQLKLMFEKEHIEKRAIIQKLANNNLILQGVALSSTPLYEKWKKYLHAPVRSHNKNMRKIERAILLYITRSITKTSPFSTFTMIGLGNLDSNSNNIMLSELLWGSNVGINNITAIQIWKSIQQSRLKYYLPLSVNNTLKLEANKYIRFVHIQQEEINSIVMKQTEKWVTLSYQEQILKIYEYIKNNTVSLRHLVKVLIPHNKLEECESFLRKLIELTLFIFKPPFADQDKNYLDKLILYLNKLTLPEEEEHFKNQLIEKINVLQKKISEYQFKNQNLVEIKSSYSEINLLLNSLSQNVNPIIYEDCFLKKKIQIPKKNMEKFEKDIQVLQNMHIWFDPQIPLKLLIKDIFLKTYGENNTCENLLEFQKLVQDEVFKDNEPSNALILDKISGNRYYQVWKRKREAIFMRIYEKFGQGKDFELDQLDLIGRKNHSFVGYEPKSWSYFIQPISANGNFVINKISDGYGKFFSRFMYGINDHVENNFLQKDLNIYTKITENNDVIFAELNGVFGFNANIHPEIADYEIVYQGVFSKRDVEKQIPLEDLSIFYDKNIHQLILYSKRLKKRVKLLYLNFLNLKLVPPVFRYLIYFSQLVNPDYSFHESYFYKLYSQKQVNSVLYFPRIYVGTQVLKRRQWWIDMNYFLEKFQLKNEKIELFIAFHKWLKDHQLPEKFYVKANQVIQYYEHENVNYQDSMKKPQYIDTNSYHLIQVFMNQLKAMGGGFIIEETLPGDEVFPVNVHGNKHMVELVVELYNEEGS